MFQLRAVLFFLTLTLTAPWTYLAAPNAPAVRVDAYGDPLPEGALTRIGSVRLRHANILWIAYLAPGDRLASGNMDAIRIWDVRTGRLVRQLNARTDQRAEPFVGHFFGFAASADGRLLAATTGMTWRVWDVTAGSERFVLENKTDRSINYLAFSPDSGYILLGDGNGCVDFWDVRQRKLVRTFRDTVRARHIAVSPDGKSLAVSDGMTAVLSLDVAKGTLAWKKKVRDGIWFLHFSADGRTLFAGSETRIVRSWDRKSGTETTPRRPEKNNVGMMMALSPDGLVGACADYVGRLSVWDMTRERELHRLTTARTECVAFSPDGATLAVGGSDGVIRLIDVTSGRERRIGSARLDAVSFADFRPDSRTLVIAGGALLGLCEARTGRELSVLQLPAGHDGRGLTEDAKQLITERADGRICLCDLATGKEARCRSADSGLGEALPRPPVVGGPDGEKDWRTAWDLTPDGRIYAEARYNRATRKCTVAARDHRNGKHVHWFFAPDGPEGGPGPFVTFWWVQRLAISPDGRRLAGVAWRGGVEVMVQVWDIATGRPLWQKRSRVGEACPVAWSPDGCLLALAGLREPRSEGTKDHASLCEAATGKELHRCPLEGGPVRALAFAANGKSLATGGRSCIVLWETATGQERCRFKGGQEAIEQLQFAPDGRLLVSVDSLSTALVWDLLR